MKHNLDDGDPGNPGHPSPAPSARICPWCDKPSPRGVICGPCLRSEIGGARIESSPATLKADDAPAVAPDDPPATPILAAPVDESPTTAPISSTPDDTAESTLEAVDPEPFSSPVDLSLSETATMPLPPRGPCRWPDCDQRSKAFGFCSTHRGRCVHLGYSTASPPAQAEVPLLPGRWEARRSEVAAKLAVGARASALKAAATRRAKVAAVAEPIPAPSVEAPQPAVQVTAAAKRSSAPKLATQAPSVSSGGPDFGDPLCAVARLVGVSPDASEAAILAAVQKMAADVDTSRAETQLLDGTLADAGFPLTKAGCAKPGCGSRHLNDRLHQLVNDRAVLRQLDEAAGKRDEGADALRSRLCGLFGGADDDLDDSELVGNVRDLIQRAGARATPAPADIVLVRKVVRIQTAALRNLAVEDVGAFGIAVNLAADTIDAVCGVGRD